MAIAPSSQSGVGGDLTSGLAAYWSMDEESNGTSTVVRGDGVGDQDLGDPGFSGAVAGKIGNAVELNETSVNEVEYLSHADSATLSMGNNGFTVSAWVYCQTLITNITVVSKFEWGADTDYEFALRVRHPSGKMGFRVSPDGASWVEVDALDVDGVSWWSMLDHMDEWVHIVAWHDPAADVLGIVVNGGPVSTMAYPSDSVFDSNQAFNVGKNGSSVTQFLELWRGLIDEVGIWKRALTPSERSELYSDGDGKNPLLE